MTSLWSRPDPASALISHRVRAERPGAGYRRMLETALPGLPWPVAAALPRVGISEVLCRRWRNLLAHDGDNVPACFSGCGASTAGDALEAVVNPQPQRSRWPASIVGPAAQRCDDEVNMPRLPWWRKPVVPGAAPGQLVPPHTRSQCSRKYTSLTPGAPGSDAAAFIHWHLKRQAARP